MLGGGIGGLSRRRLASTCGASGWALSAKKPPNGEIANPY
jgi:hypothetical protein